MWIREGFYRFDTTMQLGPEDSGTKHAPVVYRAGEGENVIFDGSRPIDAASFHKVEDASTLERLCPAARGKTFCAVIEDESTVKALSSSGARLSIDGRMMQLAQFPNVGYCHIKKILDQGAVYAQGRTMSEVPRYSMQAPVGGVFTIVEGTSGDWEAEFKRVQKAVVTGYLSNDWYRENHRIADIRDGAIQLLEYSRYGVRSSGKIARRLVVRNLLCELNQPGEWYFDEVGRTLFLWPFESMHTRTRLGCWSGPSFAVMSGASNVTIRDITVQCTGRGEGLVVVKGGSDNLVAGCTFRNSTRTGVVLSGGDRNGMVGCDLYDLGGHLILEGGDRETLTPAGNYARNNHFTQVESRDLYGRVRIRGVGNRFQNNLLHNFVGQPIVVSGNDHVLEKNEIFNVGFEEGDGGTIYAATGMWTHGNVYRHNFLHHIMCTPEAHPRGGIYQDHLDSGDTITGNVFYKCAQRAVLLNGGAGHVVSNNVFLNGHVGIYQTAAWAQKWYEDKARFDTGELKRGDITDHIWRTEQVVGKEGWNRPPWSTKYPLFRKIMNQEKMRWWPIECTFTGNLFCGNEENIRFRARWGRDGLRDVSEVEYITARNNRDISLDAFVDPGCLDFRFKEGKRPDGFPEIPFGQIGLVADPYRKNVPNSAAYRRVLKAKWDDRKSYDEKAVYDPRTITELIYFNTGKLLFSGQTSRQDTAPYKKDANRKAR
ncbi:MAG: right-handed parallel beta-helix repeat-containing protein [Planctomycetota bacterium]